MRIFPINNLIEATRNRPIVFAYYIGDAFVGFRADTFGIISKTHAKVYTNTERQIEIIHKNFNSEITGHKRDIVNGRKCELKVFLFPYHPYEQTKEQITNFINNLPSPILTIEYGK